MRHAACALVWFPVILVVGLLGYPFFLLWKFYRGRW